MNIYIIIEHKAPPAQPLNYSKESRLYDYSKFDLTTNMQPLVPLRGILLLGDELLPCFPFQAVQSRMSGSSEADSLVFCIVNIVMTLQLVSTSPTICFHLRSKHPSTAWKPQSINDFRRSSYTTRDLLLQYLIFHLCALSKWMSSPILWGPVRFCKDMWWKLFRLCE